MKVKHLLSCILIITSLISRAQVTHLESYYDGQGGIEGLYYPNWIVTGTNGQDIFIAANNCVTHLSTDSTYISHNFIEKISYSSHSFPGLWNVDEIAVYNRCLYVTGDNHLNVFHWNQSSDSLELIQSFTNNDTIKIGYAGSSKIAISPDNKNLYLSTSLSGQDHILIFRIDSLTGELMYKKKKDVDDVIWIMPGSENRYLYSASFGYLDTSVCVFERIINSDSLALIQTLTADDNLTNPTRITTSQDGKSVYVYNGYHDKESLIVYNADDTSGTLTFSQKIDINACFDNFWQAFDLTLSPDDKYFYMAGMQDISVFSRDTSTGHLTFVQVLQEGQNGLTGLDHIKSIHFANDTIMYAVSTYDDKLHVFRRNPSDGLLTHLKTITDEDGKIRGLSFAIDIVITNDDKNIYTLADGGVNAIGIYKRLQDGRLLFYRGMKWDELGPIIGAAHFFEMSPDDNYLFVNFNNRYGIRILRRAPDTGELFFYKTFTDPGLGLSDPITDITFSHDQQNFYTSTGFHILTYSVDPDSADITFQSFLSSDDPGSFGLSYIRRIIASSDGKNIYTASYSPFSVDGISVYSRNQTNGSLSVLQTISYQSGVTIIEPAKALLSPDNRFLYSIGQKIHCFERDTMDGSLSFLYEIAIEDLGISNLHKLWDAAISADGKSFIGVTRQGKSILSFHRNRKTGELTFEQHKYYSANSNYSNDGPSVCISSDLRNVYLNDQYSDLLAAYDLNIPVGLSDFTSGCGEILVLSVDEEYNCIWSTGESTNSILIDSDGDYFVYVTDSLGREGWDTTTVIFYPELIVDLGSDTTLQLSDSIYLFPDVQGSWNNSYFWNDSSDLFYKLIVCSDYGIGDHMFTVEVIADNGCFDTDTIIISVDQDNSVSEIPNLDLIIYPNPVHDKIIIETVLTGNEALFTISDIYGKVLISEHIKGVQTQLDISKLTGGVYLGILTDGDTVVVKKFIKK